MRRLLAVSWCGNRMYFEAARIERPTQPAHHTTFACSIPTLQDNDRTVRRTEISLLDALERFLHIRQAALVIRKLYRRKAFDRGKARAPSHKELSRFHFRLRRGNWRDAPSASSCAANFAIALAPIDFSACRLHSDEQAVD